MENRFVEFFKNKVVLVAGGTGSIGGEIVRKLVKYPVKQVRILSRDEFKQFGLEQEFRNEPLGRVSLLIGDIRDRERTFMAMEGVNIVFNAAAMKHVPLCEFNPFEAVKTNVLGTQNLVDAARAHNVEKFIHISTDKAAMPTSVMGATKLLAEKIATSAEHYKGKRKTVFSSVRFGNVFKSRGSVSGVFSKQIETGGPLTLTSAKMTRFVMQIPEAVDLVFKAALLSKGEELFILKMPIMCIEDLAKAMIEVLAPRCGRKKGEIKIKVIGKREGEKNYELLMHDEEAENVYENSDMFCIAKKPVAGFRPSALKHYKSDESKAMPYKEVLEFVKRSYSEE